MIDRQKERETMYENVYLLCNEKTIKLRRSMKLFIFQFMFSCVCVCECALELKSPFYGSHSVATKNLN
jgi:hypothetical protein